MADDAPKIDVARLEAIAAAELRDFLGSKTVKLVGAIVLASTSAYLQGVLAPTPGAEPAVSLKVWLVSLVGSLVLLAQRHTAAALAGLKAANELDAKTETKP